MTEREFKLPRHLNTRKGYGSKARGLGSINRSRSRSALRRIPLLGGLRGPRGRRVWHEPRKGKRWARRLRWTAAITSVIVIIGAVGGYAYYRHLDNRIKRFDEGVVTPRQVDSPSTNYLIVGVDSREGGNADVGAGSESDAPGYRTDTMMLVHISKNSKKATIVSFPRDSRVLIPGHGYDKLNAAVPYGGPKLLVETIQNLTQIHVDHFVQIDFQGFVSMTNSLGGVNVCLTEPAKDAFTGIDLSAGEHHLNGAQALQYVRQRHGLAGEDIGRIKRQQAFIGSMVRAATSAKTLFNPLKLNAFLNAATGAMKLDDDLGLSQLRTLANKLRSLDPSRVQFETIPVKDSNGSVGGVSYVLLDEPAILPFFADVESDADIDVSPTPTPTAVAPSPTPTAAAPLIVAPGKISVKVLNGTGVSGKAKAAADELATRGFAIAGTGNAATETVTQTVIRYAPEKSDSARTLQAAVPGSLLQISATAGTELTLILGTDYTGTKAVVIPTKTASASAGSSVSSSPTPVTAANDECGA